MKSLLLALAVLSVYTSYGQEMVTLKKQKHEISAGYGYITRQQVLNNFFNVRKDYSSGFEEDRALTDVFGHSAGLYLTDGKESGAVSVGYKYHILPFLSAGITVAAETERMGIFNRQNETVGRYRKLTYTLAGEARIRYSQRKLATTYGMLGLGNTFVNERTTSDVTGGDYTNNYQYFAFQLTPFGLSIGRALSGYMEAGFGYKGTIHIGASYKF